MKKKSYIWQKKELQLSDEEKILYNDYLKDEAMARYSIWGYVENDCPIPNELKPILLDLLKANYKGKSKSDTATHWTFMVKEIAYSIQEKGITQDTAIKEIADKYNEEFSTVERRYRDGRYHHIKKAIKSISDSAK